MQNNLWQKVFAIVKDRHSYFEDRDIGWIDAVLEREYYEQRGVEIEYEEQEEARLTELTEIEKLTLERQELERELETIRSKETKVKSVI